MKMMGPKIRGLLSLVLCIDPCTVNPMPTIRSRLAGLSRFSLTAAEEGWGDVGAADYRVKSPYHKGTACSAMSGARDEFVRGEGARGGSKRKFSNQ
ncbi:hypothetical protein CDAR_250511 [Caerostris darwini]|uniref:Secreted protein n=1 Tax=Caerostris darwini TaxID=1538125 RepID=A0AAV4UEB6_9ARAC|nr:hypothetical protein CDAR_250511 [Caerostris darwini]